MATITAIQKKDIDALERSLKTLSENMSSVANDVVDINGQINDFNSQVDALKSNVKSLEQEIKDFMLEVRGSSLVSNAQNEILLKENELNKKYGHYDLIRRKINGILNSIDLNTIKKNTLLTQSEQSLLNTPNYYLSYALVALCAWFRNEKKLARKALNKALNLNDSKTSLLFCLIHIRLNRNETALKWLKRYLDTQDPNNMDNDIINVLESLVSDTYSVKMTDLILSYINDWCIKLDSNSNINNYQIDRWREFFSETIETIESNDYPFSMNYIKNFDKLKTSLEISYSYNNAYSKFLNLLNDNKQEDKSIDELLNSLLFSYEDNEAELRKSILKNKLIIECKGNIEEANKKYKLYNNSLNIKNNFGNELTNAILNRNDVSLSTKKLAISLTKQNIVKGFEEAFSNDGDPIDTEVEIKINEWIGVTKDGSNEKELQDSLTDYVKKPFALDSQEQQYISPKTIYCGIFIVVGFILSFIKLYIGLIVILVGGGMLMYFLLEISKNRQDIIIEYNETINKYLFELNNTLAEIVDIKFICKRNLKYKNELISYINSFDKNNYINFK